MTAHCRVGSTKNKTHEASFNKLLQMPLLLQYSEKCQTACVDNTTRLTPASRSWMVIFSKADKGGWGGTPSWEEKTMSPWRSWEISTDGKSLMAKLHKTVCVYCTRQESEVQKKKRVDSLRGRNSSVLKPELPAVAGRPTEPGITDHRSLWMVIGCCWLRLLRPQ